ncbi:DUF1501 domain-containing protein [Gimesia aquarii]|uniref:DUF1501 domain-containing protein n=1 Tax=Gimesia aquarii TaxID=2527964 RepID=A0A517W3V6_9PLAN|nr:DUF1501 domain-containing protein [Gimesia aquarii]QDT99941.1 hypothetical protein V144x_54550 [Gimesia aquarii]
MLNIFDQSASKFCNQVSRRNFIKVGALGLGGLSLPQVLKAKKQSGKSSSHKSIIMIYLPGGPPHQDMYDLKTDAPAEVRGEFKPISTNVPDIRICEHLPGLARIADKCVFVNSLVGSVGQHASFQCMTGHNSVNQPAGGWPELGSALSHLKGNPRAISPAYVNLSPRMQHTPYNFGKNSFLGMAHTPFNPNGEMKGDMTLNGITLDRLHDRKSLLNSFDQFRRDADSSGAMQGLDSFNEQAFGVLTSGGLVEALDLSKEDSAIRERYGKGTEKKQGDAAPRLNEQFLLARRLVEAGARVVTLSYSFWDWHSSNFKRAKENFPDFDQAITALIEDLHQRGMAEDTTVIAWGEFGRTPMINKQGGRDHWPRVCNALLAGGGMKTGQVIGTTDRLGGEAKDRPVHFQEVFATLYHNMGIDVQQLTLPDHAGRPQYLVDSGYLPLAEVI